MKIKENLIFWLIVATLLTGLFGVTLSSFLIAFYFVTFLVPVILGTSLFFNHYLVPNFLLAGKKFRFYLYFTYMLIVSIYLELVVMTLAFVILADYQIANLGKIAGDIYLLTLILYLIVSVEGMVLVLKKLKQKEWEVSILKDKLKKGQTKSISIKVNRKQVILHVVAIKYVESLGDYVKVFTHNDTYITKERISSLAARLPSLFLRVHRSYLVNRSMIHSYSSEHIRIHEQDIPLGRKYKKEVIDTLKSATDENN